MIIRRYSLTAELREKKEITQKLTAENNDMAQDLAALRYRESKNENDLSNAHQMIRQLHGQLLKEETHAKSHIKGVEPPQAPETLKQSISKLLAKLADSAKRSIPKLLTKEFNFNHVTGSAKPIRRSC
ncbi:hypothetical protein DPMN_169181 [Dreissena polymorpha]|uniref:Uncharacterized protein n=1 Tax=Dreissena polymorpha TaxID=45954 RepID=A0A9D4J0C4_DREPO|nr:hypothetical protein DPMN_169181 [Dreissena polymorpha]